LEGFALLHRWGFQGRGTPLRSGSAPHPRTYPNTLTPASNAGEGASLFAEALIPGAGEGASLFAETLTSGAGEGASLFAEALVPGAGEGASLFA
jgi:hypothetical protein